MRQPGAPPASRDAYHHPQSPPSQTPSRLHHVQTSPTHPHFPSHSHQHHPASPSRAAALPPISTALYAHESSAPKYYDPPTDGDRRLSQSAPRYDAHYPPQVRCHPHLHPPPSPVTVHLPQKYACRDVELTTAFDRLGTPTPTRTAARRRAPSPTRTARPSRAPSPINRRRIARRPTAAPRPAWRPCRTRPCRPTCTRRSTAEPCSRHRPLTTSGGLR